MKIVETRHQYCYIKKTQDKAYCDVAMATILVPVSFFSEPKMTICDSITRERRTCSIHTMPILWLVSSLTIKQWMMFVKPKKGGTSFSQERGLDAKLLPWQHHNIRYCVSFLRYITAAKFQLRCVNISKDIIDFMICLPT